jgi:hypothetical protein
VKALGAKWDGAKKVWYITDVADLTETANSLPTKFSAYSAGLKIGQIVEISVRPLLWNTPPLSRLAGYGLAVGFVFYGRLVYFWRVSADKVP